MTSHLATRNGILCHTVARWPAKSGDLRDVTCTRCLRRLPVVVDQETEAYAERRRMAAAAEAADYLGAGFVWSLVSTGETASERMVRELLAAIFVGLVEQYRQDVAA